MSSIKHSFFTYCAVCWQCGIGLPPGPWSNAGGEVSTRFMLNYTITRKLVVASVALSGRQPRRIEDRNDKSEIIFLWHWFFFLTASGIACQLRFLLLFHWDSYFLPCFFLKDFLFRSLDRVFAKRSSGGKRQLLRHGWHKKEKEVEIPLQFWPRKSEFRC